MHLVNLLLKVRLLNLESKAKTLRTCVITKRHQSARTNTMTFMNIQKMKMMKMTISILSKTLKALITICLLYHHQLILKILVRVLISFQV
jgi:hypothetical protein